MPGTIKMFCIRMNILSHRNNIVLFLACNMAGMQNLYCLNKSSVPPCFVSCISYRGDKLLKSRRSRRAVYTCDFEVATSARQKLH